MRARFIRGMEPKEALGLRPDLKVKKFLTEIKGDFQLDPKDDRYLGFINVSEDAFMDVDLQEGFKIFIETWPKYEQMMYELGLDTEERPDIEETVFVNYPIKNPQ